MFRADFFAKAHVDEAIEKIAKKHGLDYKTSACLGAWIDGKYMHLEREWNDDNTARFDVSSSTDLRDLNGKELEKYADEAMKIARFVSEIDRAKIEYIPDAIFSADERTAADADADLGETTVEELINFYEGAYEEEYTNEAV